MTVADVVGRVESNNNPGAIRFEPEVYEKGSFNDDTIATIVSANNCSVHTARMIYSTSWGEFQIMGHELYTTCGFRKSLLYYLTSMPEQVASLDAYLMHTPLRTKVTALGPATVFNSLGIRALFAREYNGPGDVGEYAEKIRDAMQ